MVGGGLGAVAFEAACWGFGLACGRVGVGVFWGWLMLLSLVVLYLVCLLASLLVGGLFLRA